MAVVPAKDFGSLVVDFTLELDATDVSIPGSGTLTVDDTVTSVPNVSTLRFDPLEFDVQSPVLGTAFVTLVAGAGVPPTPGIVYTDGVSFLTEAALTYNDTNNQVLLVGSGNTTPFLIEVPTGAGFAIEAENPVGDYSFIRLGASLYAGVVSEGAGSQWAYGSHNSGDFRIVQGIDMVDPQTFTIDLNGNVVPGTLVTLAQAATDGFLYVPLIADAPSGVPTAFTGKAPITVDETNDTLNFYSNGTWRAVIGGGATVPGSAGVVYTDAATLLTDAVFQFDDVGKVLTLDGTLQVGTVPNFEVIAGAPGTVTVTSADFQIFSGGANQLFSGGDNNIVVGPLIANIAAATDGFLYIPTVSATPVGVPTTYIGKSPIQVDTANDELTFYSNGAWHTAGGASVPAAGIVYSDGAALLTDGAVLFYDDVNVRVGIGLNTPGDELEISKSVAGGNVGQSIRNTNTAASSQAFSRVEVNGSGAGDPIRLWSIATVGQHWVAGIDNDASDHFKISRGLSPGTTDSLILTTGGNVIAGHETSLAQGATDGFLYIPLIADDPSGTPTAYTGKAPIAVDDTNDELKFYSSGAWHTAGGGGGAGTVNSVTDNTTTVANPPEIVFDPVWFDVTDSGGDAAVTMVASHVQGRIWPVANPPTVSNWTWVNQGTASATDNSDGSVTLTGASAGSATQIRALVRSLPSSTDFDVRMGFLMTPQALQTTLGGLILRESGTSKMLFSRWGVITNTLTHSVHAMTNNTTYGSAYFDPSGADVFLQLAPVFFRFTRASSGNIFFYYSNDGQKWISSGSQAATNPFTTAPDQYGFALDAFNGEIHATLFYLSVA